MNRRLKIALIILLIILVSIISFVGIFVQDTKFMKNILPEYQLGMDLAGYRAISIAVNDGTETIYYDKDGNQVDTEAEDGTSEEVPINSEEVLTGENYQKTKQIIEDRLLDLGITEYLVRLNEDNGTITVQIPEDDMTDTASQFLYTPGKFTIEDEDGNVLMDNSNLERVQIGYGQSSSTTTAGTTVYINFVFNEDSVEKFKEITNTYVESTDEEGNDTSKNVSLNIDGSALITTSFNQEISNGILQLSMGTATDNETFNSYLQQASNIAILLNNGPIEIEYTVDQNRYIKSDLTLENMLIPAIIVGVILVIAFLFLIIRYKKLGLLAVISFIGYVALLLILIRYTNVVITIEGIFGLIISAILNYILLVYILNVLRKTEKDVVEYRKAYNKSMISMILVLVPAIIIGIVLCFANWLPAFSFGMVTFWGVLLIALYNASVTRVLALNSINNKVKENKKDRKNKKEGTEK